MPRRRLVGVLSPKNAVRTTLTTPALQRAPVCLHVGRRLQRQRLPEKLEGARGVAALREGCALVRITEGVVRAHYRGQPVGLRQRGETGFTYGHARGVIRC